MNVFMHFVNLIIKTRKRILRCCDGVIVSFETSLGSSLFAEELVHVNTICQRLTKPVLKSMKT